MPRSRFAGLCLAATLIALPFAAAGQQKGGSDSEGDGGNARRGRRIFFTTAACSGCHRVHGRGGVTAPDLSEIGATREEAYIAAKMYNPRLGNPQTIMPSAGDLGLNDNDVADVATFLAGLK